MSQTPGDDQQPTPDTNPLAGLDLGGLLQQAQAMQQQLVSAQEEMARTEYVGTVADGLVTATVDGTGDLLRIGIRANSFDPADTEDLEDLVVAAYRDARARAEAASAERLGPLSGMLDALRGGSTDDPDDPEGRPQTGF